MGVSRLLQGTGLLGHCLIITLITNLIHEMNNKLMSRHWQEQTCWGVVASTAFNHLTWLYLLWMRLRQGRWSQVGAARVYTDWFCIWTLGKFLMIIYWTDRNFFWISKSWTLLWQSFVSKVMSVCSKQNMFRCTLRRNRGLAAVLIRGNVKVRAWWIIQHERTSDNRQTAFTNAHMRIIYTQVHNIFWKSCLPVLYFV